VCARPLNASRCPPSPTGATALLSLVRRLHEQAVPVQPGLLGRHMGTEQHERDVALEPGLAHRPGLYDEQEIVWPPASAGPRLRCFPCPPPATHTHTHSDGSSLKRERWEPFIHILAVGQELCLPSALRRRCAHAPPLPTLTRLLACVRNQVPHILPARPNPKKEVLVLPFLAGGPRGMSSQKVCLIYVLAGHRDAAHAGRQPEQQDPV
jgi:hypothetical protein